MTDEKNKELGDHQLENIAGGKGREQGAGQLGDMVGGLRKRSQAAALGSAEGQEEEGEAKRRHGGLGSAGR
jgi:hypothetical protein